MIKRYLHILNSVESQLSDVIADMKIAQIHFKTRTMEVNIKSIELARNRVKVLIEKAVETND